jgi:hypothetical protein
MANRGVDLLITYRIVKLMATPFDKQEAFKYGIIDKNGKVLRPARTLNTEDEKNAYTILHRFVFNLKRIIAKAGLKSSLSSFSVALALILKENKELIKHKSLIENTIIKYLKKNNLYQKILNEQREIIENDFDKQKIKPFITVFGVDVYESGKGFIAENVYAEEL